MQLPTSIERNILHFLRDVVKSCFIAQDSWGSVESLLGILSRNIGVREREEVLLAEVLGKNQDGLVYK